MSYETVIGLEIHAQLRTQTKIFCGCSTQFGATPNSQVCPVCLGLPGALPVLNRHAVDLAIKAALALGCEIQDLSIFARKNYFYPDLPKGYQISQYEQPLALKGLVEFDVNGHSRSVGITRVHMEEDAGKSLHEGFSSSEFCTYLDFNRSGVPLVEIVTEPEMRSSDEAAAFFTWLRDMLVWLGVNDGNMEEGSLRCDANVSIRPTGQSSLGTKVEVKNINSFRYLQKALNYEVDRQIDVVDKGEAIQQETRLWDSSGSRTLSMRSKEEAHDYRYFPEPDLPPLVTNTERVAAVRATMPELPDARRLRFIKEYGIPEYDAGVLTQTVGLADYFEETVAAGASGKGASNWIMGELLRIIKENNVEIGSVSLTPNALAGLIALIEKGVISSSTAKDVFGKMYESDQSASEIVEREGLAQIGDKESLHKIVCKTIDTNADAVAQYQAGKHAAFGFLVGQVMKASQGKANPKLVNELLKEELSKHS